MIVFSKPSVLRLAYCSTCFQVHLPPENRHIFRPLDH